MLDIGEVTRRIVLTAVVVAMMGFATRLVLKSYSLELVHIVVANAVTQKAPDDYPKSKIHEVFSSCLQQVQKGRGEDLYREQLLTLAHGLEKVQFLEGREVDSLLRDLKCN